MASSNSGEGASKSIDYASLVDMSDLELYSYDSHVTNPKYKKYNTLDDLYNEFKKRVNQIKQTHELANTIESLKLEKPVVTNTFEDESIDYQYGSVIRDADNALKEVESQPGTEKSIKMIEYYSNQCPFILSLLKQEKSACKADEKRFSELQKAEDCLERLAKCFADKRTSS